MERLILRAYNAPTCGALVVHMSFLLMHIKKDSDYFDIDILIKLILFILKYIIC